MFGIVGFAAALLLLLLHMFSLTSFGEPYMQAAAPLRKRLLEDSIIRAPLDVLFKRSHNWGTKKGSQ
jgi:spore germination protein KA